MRALKSDEGLGIAEVLVAILLFGILAVALVPPIILSIQVTAESTTRATASQVVSERIDLARAASGSCAEFLTFLQTAVPTTYEDARGVSFDVVQTPSPSTAAGYVVSGDASLDADGDGVADAFCNTAERNAVSFGVAVEANSLENSDSASAVTIVAVPGFGS